MKESSITLHPDGATVPGGANLLGTCQEFQSREKVVRGGLTEDWKVVDDVRRWRILSFLSCFQA